MCAPACNLVTGDIACADDTNCLPVDRCAGGVCRPGIGEGEGEGDVVIARDDFERNDSGGWGGGWTLSGSTDVVFSVDGDGVAIINAAGSAYDARLPIAGTIDVELFVEVVIDKLSTGGSGFKRFYSVETAGVGPTVEIRTSDDEANLLVQLYDAVGALGATVAVAGLVDDTTPVALRLRVTGDPPTLQAKVWHASDSEPPDWTLAEPSTAAAQTYDTVRIGGSISTVTTNAPVTFRWRLVEVRSSS